MLLSLEESNDEIIEAIDDFIRCISERTRLSVEGMLTKQDFIAFEERLRERWRLIFNRYKRRLSSSSYNEKELSDIGYEILMETLQHREILAGQQTEEYYLTKGSYHKLADFLEVGWHPNFDRLLKGE